MSGASNGRVPVKPSTIADVLSGVMEMTNRRLVKHGADSFVNGHEAYGVLAEEVAELLDELRANNVKGQDSEWFDIAVTAVFALASNEQRRRTP